MLRVVGYTNIGGRNENEDSYDYFYEYFQKQLRFCAVVADGLGGHGGGAEASQTTVEYFKRVFQDQKDCFVQKLDENMNEINSIICSKQTEREKMRTTVAVLTIENGYVTTAHVGDSRIYHFVDGKIVNMTFDHSVSQLAVLSGEITQEDVRHHIDRNKLLRSIGKSDGVKTEINSWGTTKEQKHAFLLCTDGFWENINEQEMTKCLEVSSGPKEWMDGMIKILSTRIGKDSDNNTAIAVWAE